MHDSPVSNNLACILLFSAHIGFLCQKPSGFYLSEWKDDPRLNQLTKCHISLVCFYDGFLANTNMLHTCFVSKLKFWFKCFQSFSQKTDDSYKIWLIKIARNITCHFCNSQEIAEGEWTHPWVIDRPRNYTSWWCFNLFYI